MRGYTGERIWKFSGHPIRTIVCVALANIFSSAFNFYLEILEIKYLQIQDSDKITEHHFYDIHKNKTKLWRKGWALDKFKL